MKLRLFGPVAWGNAMKLSTKGRYAMVALADLALQPAGALVSLGEISRRQDISLPYLEQLFVKLRRADLVESVRGPGGGYRLARGASEIRVSEILGAVDETVSAMHKGLRGPTLSLPRVRPRRRRWPWPGVVCGPGPSNMTR
jgi:Rrf2 family protein